MAQKQILIICGEPSGELHASNLTREINKLQPDIKIFGVGTTLLKNSGAQIIFDTNGLSVMGLFDVLKKLPQFINLKDLILKKIESKKIDAVIFVDFSGFNLRLAQAINNRIKTIYYVSPQVWASRPGRIKTIKEYIGKMIVLFEFEKEFYKKYGIDAEFVGHPLLDIVSSETKRTDSKSTIALLPGSRKQEIKRILPIMLEAAGLISKKTPVKFIIAKSPGVDWDTYKEILKAKAEIKVEVVEGRTYDCLKTSDFAFVCSGTATLETAIMGTPFLIIYKTSLLNYLLYRPQIKLPYIGLVNIIAGKKIIPEFIQFGASPKKISNQALEILNNPAKLQTIKTELAKIKSSLGTPGAASRAAKIICDFLK